MSLTEKDGERFVRGAVSGYFQVIALVGAFLFVVMLCGGFLTMLLQPDGPPLDEKERAAWYRNQPPLPKKNIGPPVGKDK